MALAPFAPNAADLSRIRSADSKLVGEAFNQKILLSSQNEDVLGQFEGNEGGNAPFCVKTDLSKGGADTVHLTTVASLGGSGRRGDQVLEGFEEPPRAGTYKVKLDQVRHGVAHTRLIKSLMSAGKSVEEVYSALTGKWFGLKKQNDMLMCLRHSAIGANTIYPNYRTSVDDLYSSDVMSTATISNAAAVLSGRGGVPAKVYKSDSGATVESYLFLGSTLGLNSLKGNNDYKAAAINAQPRDVKKNTTFRGGFVDWDGHSIYHWNVKDEVTYGPQGAPILAKATVGDPVTAGTGALTLYGSGITQALLGDDAALYEPFQWFPGYRYAFTSNSTDLMPSDSNYYYFVIYDPADGKYCIYQYQGSTGNNGYRLLTTARLAAAASGQAVTTLCGEAWDSNKHKEAFGTGCIVVPVNAKRVRYTEIYVLGASTAVRAYGDTPMEHIWKDRDYGERRGLSIRSIYGQAAALETDGQPHNYVKIVCAVDDPVVRLPAVLPA